MACRKRRSEVFELEGVRLRQLGPADAPAIQGLLLRCADFIHLIEGRQVAPGDGAEMLHERPPDAPDVEKRVIGVFDGPELVGVIEFLIGYPAEGSWYVGLYLLDPDRRRAGLGGRLYAAFQDWAQREGCRTVRLAVQDQNAAAFRFWTRQGFHPIGTVIQDLPNRRNTVHRMQRELRAGEARA
jgi:GNAT superfamily N-acetyltransferase